MRTLSKALLGVAATANRTRRLGWPAPHGADRVHEGWLSRILFNDPDVSPRLCWRHAGRSTLANTINKVSAALDGPYDELLRMLPAETVLNIDETGHKCNKELWWTWCLRADLYTIFKIDPHRNADVLMELLGRDFEGTIGCDYFSAYRRYMRECDIRIQFCLSHLIRDVKFLTTLPDVATKAYGERLRRALKQLFEVIHRREDLSATAFERQLKAARDVVLDAGMTDVPTTRHAENMAKRFRKHGGRSSRL